MGWGQVYATIEDERVRKHLENTENKMREKDCSHLSDELKQAREEKISLLHEYWKAGNFPINTDFAQLRLPHIKDRFGTPCAMAYLIEESGGNAEHKLIEHLYKNNNNVFLKDVHDGPVIEWINKSGITKEEACQIQPTYPSNRCEDKDGKIINYTFIKPSACVKVLDPLPTPFCKEGQDSFGFIACRPRNPILREPRDSITPNVRQRKFRTKRIERIFTQSKTDRASFQEKERKLRLKRASRKKSLTTRRRR